MALGPLVTYVPPGVYTRTLTEANAANLVAGLRIPVIIGVGQEQLTQSNLELIRGSSANLDQQILSENASARFVLSEVNPSNPTLGAADGLVSKLRVRNFPIVDGNGFGRITNDVRSVSVSINGLQVAVGAVQGSSGYVTLQVPPQPGDDVRVTYFFRRTDTAFTDNVSDQVTQTNAELTSPGVGPFVITARECDHVAGGLAVGLVPQDPDRLSPDLWLGHGGLYGQPGGRARHVHRGSRGRDRCRISERGPRVLGR